MKSDNDSMQKLNYKHWLFQVVPPLFMLGILFAVESGAALIFLAGFYIFPVLFSLISIFAKLLNFKKRKYYLIRPFLTIAVFFTILSIAQWTYKSALEQAIIEAEILNQQCNIHMMCPKNPEGWVVDGSRISKSDLGFWLTYTAYYYYQAESFNIRVYHGPDMGDHIAGGIDQAITVTHYIDG